MKLNSTNTISLIILLVAIIASTLVQIYTFDKRAIDKDEPMHFYDMQKHYQSGKIPPTSARFIGTPVQMGEFSTPRVPGGAFYIFYTLFYKLAGANGIDSLDGARLINMIFSFAIIIVFLFWFYKRFGTLIAAIFSAFILINSYIIMATTNFWNPNITLLFSFPLFICLYEYISENKKSYAILGSIFAFPVLAIMAQGHFATFYCSVPTLIVYLIIRCKQTKKYIKFWALGIFISFLLYLPYIVFEIQNDFNNLNLALKASNVKLTFPFPQVHALFIFPTNEMSVFFGTRFEPTLYFWTTDKGYFIGLPFLFASVLFSVFYFVRAFIFLFKSKNISISKNESIIREFIFILLIFIPTTILSFVIFQSKSGTFRYLYSAFAISFSPLILFLLQIENTLKNDKKKLYIAASILILNIAIMSGQFTRYIHIFQEPRNYEAFKKMVLFIKDDAKDNKIKVYNRFGGNMPYQYEDIFNTYFSEIDVKTTYKNQDITYSIVDNVVRYNWGQKRNDREIEFVIKNNAEIIYESKGFTVYKFPEPVDF